jgi:hypothetical protein
MRSSSARERGRSNAAAPGGGAGSTTPGAGEGVVDRTRVAHHAVERLGDDAALGRVQVLGVAESLSQALGDEAPVAAALGPEVEEGRAHARFGRPEGHGGVIASWRGDDERIERRATQLSRALYGVGVCAQNGGRNTARPAAGPRGGTHDPQMDRRPRLL